MLIPEDYKDKNQAITRAYVTHHPEDYKGFKVLHFSNTNPVFLFDSAQIIQVERKIINEGFERISLLVKSKSSRRDKKLLLVKPNDPGNYLFLSNNTLVQGISEGSDYKGAIIIFGHSQTNIDKTAEKLGLPLEERV